MHALAHEERHFSSAIYDSGAGEYVAPVCIVPKILTLMQAIRGKPWKFKKIQDLLA